MQSWAPQRCVFGRTEQAKNNPKAQTDLAECVGRARSSRKRVCAAGWQKPTEGHRAHLYNFSKQRGAREIKTHRATQAKT